MYKTKNDMPEAARVKMCELLNRSQTVGSTSRRCPARATLAAATRKGIDEASDARDADTADLLTEVSRAADKYLWLVEAHLQSAR